MRLKVAVGIKHISDAARHPGGKISPCFAKHHHGAACHVFTAVITRTFHNGTRSRQTHRKALARNTVEIGFARSRTIKRRVAGDDVFLTLAVKINAGPHDDAAARKSLADIVIGVAL